MSSSSWETPLTGTESLVVLDRTPRPTGPLLNLAEELLDRPALDPQDHSGGNENNVHRDNKEPDEPPHPAARDPQESNTERRLTPARPQNRRKTRGVGKRRHPRHVFQQHIVVVKADAVLYALGE